MARFDTRSKDIRNLPGFGVTATLAVAFLYAPILFLVMYSFKRGPFDQPFWTGCRGTGIVPFSPMRKLPGQH